MKYPKKCPWCGNKLIIKDGKYGIFLGCIKYPSCKYTYDLRNLLLCPKCGNRLIIKTGKRGDFIGCTGYPNCNYTIDLINKNLTEIPCPVCGEFMVIRKSPYNFFMGCQRFPKCRYTFELRRSYEKFNEEKQIYKNYLYKEYSSIGKSKTEPLITTQKIIKLLSNEWKSINQIGNELGVKEKIDLRYLKIKLKNLERNNIIRTTVIKNENFFKIINL